MADGIAYRLARPERDQQPRQLANSNLDQPASESRPVVTALLFDRA